MSEILPGPGVHEPMHETDDDGPDDDQEPDGPDRQWEDDYRAHSPSITGVYEAP